MAAATVSIQPIHTRRELREFVAFMWEIYKDDPLWVPPVFEARVARLDPKRNPMLKHGELRAFVARRSGRLVGTIAGAIDHQLQHVIPDPFAAFGFFECVDDYAVAQALLDAVVDPTTIVRGIIMKVIIIVVLAKAISAGLQHRKLMQEGPIE